MKPVILFSALLALSISASSHDSKAADETPVGLVEELADIQLDIEEFDYVYEGQQINLGQEGELVLSYFSSCRLERLKGGQVEVGQKSSQTTGELLDQQTMECVQSQLVASNEDTESAVFVFRGSKDDEGSGIRLYSTLPAIKVTRPIAYAQINRMDLDGENWLISLKPGLNDLAKQAINLEPGGTYQLVMNEERLTFTIARTALATDNTVLGRVIIY